jgi:hypothetical protein
VNLDAEAIERAARSELPSLLGRLVELEALVRLRLAEAPAVAAAEPWRLLDADAAAAIAGTTKRWLLTKTRGMGFRRDLSRKLPRFDEAGLRTWLAGRRR